LPLLKKNNNFIFIGKKHWVDPLAMIFLNF
jgi:hypothetical protein